MKGRGGWILILLAALLVSQSIYFVDEREQVIVTQFGEPIGDAVTEAGLKFKAPFIQVANRFEKRVLEWDGFPEEFPTLDKTFLFVDTTARWRISDPLLFFESVRTEQGGQSRLDDILDSRVRNVITSHNLIEAVRSTDRSVDVADRLPEDAIVTEEFTQSLVAGRLELERLILVAASAEVRRFGIELIDIRIKRINYVEQVQQTVFGRMISERNRVAERFRSEGQGDAAKIDGERQRDLDEIQSAAYRRAEEIRGTADAEATRIYAEAYEAHPEFYRFWRLLQVYEGMRGDNLTMLLTTSGEFYRLLVEGGPTGTGQ